MWKAFNALHKLDINLPVFVIVTVLSILAINNACAPPTSQVQATTVPGWVDDGGNLKHRDVGSSPNTVRCFMYLNDPRSMSCVRLV